MWHAQVFGGDHKITQWMTAPSLEALGGVEIMGAGKHKVSHMKQVPALHFQLCYVCPPASLQS